MGSPEQTETEVVPANDASQTSPSAAADEPSVLADEPSEPSEPSVDADGADSIADGGKNEKKKKAERDDAPRQKRSRSGLEPNNVRKLRQEAMMSKAELARRAGVSPLTIDRVEAGSPCRMDTKRKILEALGLKPSARAEVWPEIDDDVV
jgi:DNA-binding XRE family transcriptional regulator